MHKDSAVAISEETAAPFATSAELDQEQLEAVIRSIPGGGENLQEMYPLSPLQEGMLFHSLLSEHGDTYLLSTLFELESSRQVPALIEALQTVIARHDILRTAVLWERLPRPIQVVCKHAELPTEELHVAAGTSALDVLKARMTPRHQRLQLAGAPLMRLSFASSPGESRAYALLQLHHIICDHQSLRVIAAETMQCLLGRGHELPPSTPYRNYIAHAFDNIRTHDGAAFFRSRLADIDAPSAPFGLVDVHGDGSNIDEGRCDLDVRLLRRVREQRRVRGISAARLFHAAWGLVVARTSGTDDVVFGTVLLAAAQRNVRTQRTVGLSVNTLPLRLRLRDVTVEELIQQVHLELIELTKHEATPLTQAQSASGIGSAQPLFTSLLNFRHGAAESDGEFAAAGVRVIARGEAWTNYPFTVTIDDANDRLTLMAKAERRIGSQRILDYVCTALSSLIEALERAPQTPALELEILPAEERHRVIAGFNATAAPFSHDSLVHELFEEQAERAPDAVAVMYEETSLTYRELNERANQLARFLRDKGVGPNQRVALCIERSVEMIIGLLAVLKAGGAYVPLDPGNPVERLEHILADAAPRVLLTREIRKQSHPVTAAEVIGLGEHWPQIRRYPVNNLERGTAPASARDLAYLIYTSGSTGKPKGVMIEHRSLVNYAVHALQQFDVAAGDGSLVCSSFSFDLMLTALYPTLLAGKTVRLCREVEGLPDLAQELLRSSNLAPLKLTPSHLALLSQSLREGQLTDRVRVLVLGGEPLQSDVVRLWRRYAPSTRIFNHYGPTETTIGCVVNEVDGSEAGAVPIGRPIANTQVYILNERQQPLPIGAIGEIYIGGAGVARGYLDQPGLTAQKFLADPFASQPNARMYRTGDLGRWRPDGLIEFLGRNDHQVKMRGFRIELGAIESQLVAHPCVRAAAVIAREDAPGEKRLVAYITVRPHVDLVLEELRADLRKRLPEYMVPSAFVVLDELPLTPNGKLNRRALPMPEVSAYTSRQYEAPIGNVEAVLAGIWQSLLRLERVGRNDNFFELGGHSLLIVQMMERLRRAGLSMQLRMAFDAPTLATLAATITMSAQAHFDMPGNGIPPDCEVITPDMLPLVSLEAEHIETIVRAVPAGAPNVQDIYPLAPLQEGILFHHLLNERGADVYVEPTVLHVESRARLDQLIAALQAAIDRHDVLRTAILWEQLPRPVQVVYRRVTLPVEQIELDAHRDSHEQIAEWIRPERQRMDLRSAPLLRLEVAADPGGSGWYVFLQRHHVICDHVTLEVLISEVVAHMNGQASQLPVSAPYRSHIAAVQAYTRTHDTQAFFQTKLADVEEPTAPFGLLDVCADGTEVDETHQDVDAMLSQRLRAQAKRLGVSPATLFHAAWGLVVAHASGRDDVVFGCVLLGRMYGGAGSQQTLGMFINTLPLRLRLRDVTLLALIEHTQRELVELLGHEQASLAVAQRCSGVPAGLPLFTALFNYRHSAPDPDSKWSGAQGVDIVAVQDRTNYPITVSVDDLGALFAINVQTDRRIPAAGIAAYLHTVLRSMIDSLENERSVSALSLEILPQTERRILLEQFSPAQVIHPRNRLVHQLVEAQAQRNQDVTALLHEGRTLTYAELNARANQLARLLVSRGLRPDQLVGVCLERGLEMIVALLAILKAGGAYVPLDPNYPAERLKYMLEDAEPQLLITQESLRATVLPMHARPIVFEEISPQLCNYASANLDALDVAGSARNLVYVMYTSGSTGRPKGTAMAHCSMVNLLEWHRHALPLDPGTRVLQFAAFSFDVAFQEIFSTLSAGGTLVLLEEWVRKDVHALARLLCEQRIERLFLPPLMLQSLAEYCKEQGASAGEYRLRDVITAGEQLRVSPQIIELFERLPGARLHNHYGPTETHVVTALTLTDDPHTWPALPAIGRPLSNTSVYILDARRQLVPLGAVGEIYIGGANVARGYWRQPTLTGERFLPDPFNPSADARIYRTGDLGRWRADGCIEYLGRNDAQVKVRGFRIEPAEIETQLALHPQVQDAAVIVREDSPGDRRLVAYVTAGNDAAPNVEELREHLQSRVPDYMIPSAFVTLPRLPVTPSGKLNRRELPAPEASAFVNRPYEAPRNEIEALVAGIWRNLLGVERVGRQDNFFELGGHSLLLVQVMERLRRIGLSATVREVYESRTLAALAQVLAREVAAPVTVPANIIPPGTEIITPEMLPLVDLQPEHIARIVRSVPGGAANVQDIYPLTALQEGMLFHHLVDAGGGDTYVVLMLFSLPTRERLSKFIEAFQCVMDRHCVLRTAVLWEQLPRPVQVVHRKVTLPVEELSLSSDRDVMEQLKEHMRPEKQRMDVGVAPLVRLRIAADPRNESWYGILQIHHLIGDHEALDTMLMEVAAYVDGRQQSLPAPQPFRDHVAQALAYASATDSESFFRSKLADVEESTTPFGLSNVRGNASGTDRSDVSIEAVLARRVRAQARRLGVSAATIFHAAWALVASQTSGRDDVIFGTVLLGRLQGRAGSGRVLGLFMNTLPLRLRLRETSATELITRTQRELVDLLSHEQAPLALAQRCSGIVGSKPLFSSLLNYRWGAVDVRSEFADVGISQLATQSFTNYPITLSVLDQGEGFLLTAMTDRSVAPNRVIGFMSTALQSLLDALEHKPEQAVLTLPVLPADERHLLTNVFNATQAPYPAHKRVHQLVEEQAKRTPDVIAVVHDEYSLSYAQLDRQANRLANYLRSQGVGPDHVVGVHIERGVEMVIALLGILKAGGAYLPLDPSYPAQRLQNMLEDAQPRILLTQEKLWATLPVTQADVVALDTFLQLCGDFDVELPPRVTGLMAHDLVYVIYTSGTTGRPKGTAMSHRSMVNLLEWQRCNLPLRVGQRVLQFAALSFDVAFQEIFSTLSGGGTLVMLDEWIRRDPPALVQLLNECEIERMFVPPMMLQSIAEYCAAFSEQMPKRLRDVITAGERLHISDEVRRFFAAAPGCNLHNHYGPTETHVVTSLTLDGDPATWPTLPTIGRPIANTQIYLLDRHKQLVPAGVIGEIYIGGANVARGYLNRPELTAERFVTSSLMGESPLRLYKTGDLGRWRSGGELEYLGRNDDQVKIRGFRIEIAEIQLRLCNHPDVREAVVVACGDSANDRRLVAYIVPAHDVVVSAEQLRAHLQAGLPEHMIPAAFVMLDKLPLTPSGKLDRRALPTPGLDAYVSWSSDPPQGPLEETLARIWQELLHIDRVGRHDNFFELGGESLMAMKLLVRIADQCAVHIRILALFEYPTIAQLAKFIEGMRAQRTVTTDADATEFDEVVL